MLKVRRPLVQEGALAEDWFHKGLHKALKINSSFRRSFGAQRSSALGLKLNASTAATILSNSANQQNQYFLWRDQTFSLNGFHRVLHSVKGNAHWKSSNFIHRKTWSRIVLDTFFIMKVFLAILIKCCFGGWKWCYKLILQ